VSDIDTVVVVDGTAHDLLCDETDELHPRCVTRVFEHFCNGSLNLGVQADLGITSCERSQLRQGRRGRTPRPRPLRTSAMVCAAGSHAGYCDSEKYRAIAVMLVIATTNTTNTQPMVSICAVCSGLFVW